MAFFLINKPLELHTEQNKEYSLWEIINKAPKSTYSVESIKNMSLWEYIAFTSWDKTYKVKNYLVNWEYIFMNDWWIADVKYYNWKACYTDHVYAFTTQNICLTKYLYYYLSAQQEYINKYLFQWTNLKNLKKKDFEKMSITLPPFPIQKAIVQVLDIMYNNISSISNEINLREQQYQYYRDSLLSK